MKCLGMRLQHLAVLLGAFAVVGAAGIRGSSRGGEAPEEEQLEPAGKIEDVVPVQDPMVNAAQFSPIYTAGEPIRTRQTPLEQLGHHLDGISQRTGAAISDATAASGEVAARMNAEAADDAATSSERVLDKIELNHLYVEDIVDDLHKTARDVARVNAEVQGIYRKGEQEAADAPQTAIAHIAPEVSDKLAPVYKGLQEWKMDVLHDPGQEGKRQGAKAAAPFNKALVITEKRVGEYQQRAEGLSDQARGLRTVAVAVANGALGKQAVGDWKGAQDDMKNAHHMLSQAGMFEANAKQLEGYAVVLSGNINAYALGGQNAAQHAEHKYNPAKFAPPPTAPVGSGGTPLLMPPGLNVEMPGLNANDAYGALLQAGVSEPKTRAESQPRLQQLRSTLRKTAKELGTDIAK